MVRNAFTMLTAVTGVAAHCISRVTVNIHKLIVGAYGAVGAVHISNLPRNIWNLPAFGWLTSRILL